MRELEFILTTGAGTFTLVNSPDGWDESMIQWARSEKYWGVFRSWSIPVKFVKDGATYLRREFYSWGTRGIGSITINRLNKVTLTYEIAYAGVIDYGTFKDTDNYVEVNFNDSGAAKYIKDYSDTEYTLTDADDIPIWDTEFTHDGADVRAAADLDNVAKALLDKMTEGKIYSGDYLFKSDLFDSIKTLAAGVNPEAIVITTGLNIRTVGTLPESALKTTFDDFYKSVNVHQDIGMGIETDAITGKPVIVIERKSYFFDTVTTPMSLGATQSINAYFDPKIGIKKIKVGYPVKEYTTELATEEPNAVSKWQVYRNETGIEYDLVSKYRADSLGVKDIKDNAYDTSDDDIFFLHLTYDPIPKYLFYFGTTVRQIGSLIYSWVVGNGKISPRNCLLKHNAFINNLVWQFSTQEINFTSGENRLYNIELQLGFAASFIPEHDDIIIGAPTLFVPIVFEIQCALPNDLIGSLNSNSRCLASFTYLGDTYLGWIMEVKAKIAGRGSGKIKLLAYYSYNNIHNLIR